ncbi:hypothetical protein GSI_00733 [Ganoderma sinense ZZ0214-1]|uniref:Uncharacterized protein n=1 Tax=Ganoderma sinense ZZ0214-1 TaxID=1077348 RepID=A0A2G8STD5_9APHY|nr:hypothetical protein GSI_00733 [Ganoderma sinense ZZ0214-1]
MANENRHPLRRPNICTFIALESATLNVYVSTSPDSDPTEDTVDVLAAFCNAVTHASHLLQSLDIFIWGSPSQWDTAVGLRNLVAPVLQASFCELRSFSFGAEDLTLRIEDATIEALVGAWPKLEHLCLDCDT